MTQALSSALRLWAFVATIDSDCFDSGFCYLCFLFIKRVASNLFTYPFQQTILTFDVAWPLPGLFLAALFAASVLCSNDTPAALAFFDENAYRTPGLGWDVTAVTCVDSRQGFRMIPYRQRFI